ncbi:MAG TPA: AAA family ATPase [Trebonia sp.]|jgi:DNA-binding CsgD family transcriptional regulator
MSITSEPGRRWTRLTNRHAECGELDGLIATVRAGQSRVLVLHGEPGVGKTALLDYLVGQAVGCRVLRAAGVQSEMELAFAGVHQLCAPVLDQLEMLPGPQREALRTTFGLSQGSVPDRFLVSLAVLGLLSDVAGDQPLICVVDDAQWLDRASAQVLAFVARRLAADPVGLVFAARVAGEELAGLPELAITGLRNDHARTLLRSVLTGPVDTRIQDQIVAETRGNPLALLELSRGATPAQLAGGFGLPAAAPLTGQIEDSFRRQLEALPGETRRLLLLAAADPSGDPLLLWRAAGRLDIPVQAEAPAVEAGLVEFGALVRFRHPLARSVAYRSASAQERRAAHRVLAEVTDALVDPDRRAWHRAQAAAGPDEDIAAELELSAGRAQARGGLAAAAAFLERATTLTPDPMRRAGRALAAAEAMALAGAIGAAQDLLATVDAGPLSEFERARADLVRAQLAFATGRSSEAPALMVAAAKLLEPIDLDLARLTYLKALASADFAGRLADPGSDIVAVARAAGAAPVPNPGSASDLLLDGLAANVNQGYAAGAPILREALSVFAAQSVPPEQELLSLSMAFTAAIETWDDDRWALFTSRYVRLAGDLGVLSELPVALSSRVFMLLFAGDLTAAAALVEEERAAAEATESYLAPYSSVAVAALRGREAEASALIEATLRAVSGRGEGIGITLIEWANAVLSNGLGRYQEALVAAGRAAENRWELSFLNWALVELVEAAARSGANETAADAYRRLTERTSASGTDWALGVDARSLALLSQGERAEERYREAIDRLGRTRIRTELARAHLLYGEWLRRERRRAEARDQLRIAHQMLEAMGMAAFADRARRELAAAGETVRARTTPLTQSQLRSGRARELLTAQEGQVAWLAREGLSNPEIGARLFISPRTVQHHLSNVFTKLGITSRSQLHTVLPSERPDPGVQGHGR